MSSFVIFLIVQDSIHPPSSIFVVYLDHSQGVLDGLYCFAIFGCDWYSSFHKTNVSMFGMFGLKMPIHTSKSGAFIHGMESSINKTRERHILTWVRVVWAIKCESAITGLTCSSVLQNKLLLYSPICPEHPAHWQICTKYHVEIGVADVIICANF